MELAFATVPGTGATLTRVVETAVSNGEVIILVVLVAAPIAAVAFAMDHEKGTSGPDLSTGAGRAIQQAEIRQMLEAKAYRQRQRGEEPIDVDEEMRRMLVPSPTALNADPALVEEVRQLVVARNARRLRQGKDPLDVEAEVSRQLEDLENLGQ